MAKVIELPAPLAERLAVEASERGLTVDEVAIEAIADRYPTTETDDADETFSAFIGCGASGRTEPFDIHEARAELAARKLSTGV